jgi:SAM-dependent methyltransferase
LENYSRHFDAYYYEHGCGRPYQRDEEWLGFFDTIAQQIAEKIQPNKVLDAGCALGFLVEKLREREIEAYGVDISEYAIANTNEAIKPYCWVGSVTKPFPKRYDLIVSIEVLEHMPKAEAERAIKNFCSHADDILFSSTPMDYKEATHFNVQQPEYWVEQFALQGFYRDVDFDASFITPWAIRFRKRSEPVHAIIKDYERKFWPLWKESTDLRALVEEMRTRLARAESELEVLVNTKDIQITSLNAEVQSLTQQVNSLSEQINDWHNHWTSIQSGMSWRLVQALIRIQPRLAPTGSRRYQFLVWMFENARKPGCCLHTRSLDGSMFSSAYYRTDLPSRFRRARLGRRALGAASRALHTGQDGCGSHSARFPASRGSIRRGNRMGTLVGETRTV